LHNGFINTTHTKSNKPLYLVVQRQGCGAEVLACVFVLCDGVKRLCWLKISNKPASAQSSKLQNLFNKIISGEMNGTEMK